MANAIAQISGSLYDQFIADIEIRSQSWPALQTNQLSVLRQKAFQQFRRLGFPSIKTEDWKYTNLTRFLKEDFDIGHGEESIEPVHESFITNAKIPSLDCYTIVLLNGKYNPNFSDTIPAEKIKLLPIGDASGDTTFKTHFGKYSDIEKNNFAALNTALYTDGLFILALLQKTCLYKHAIFL